MLQERLFLNSATCIGGELAGKLVAEYEKPPMNRFRLFPFRRTADNSFLKYSCKFQMSLGEYIPNYFYKIF